MEFLFISRRIFLLILLSGLCVCQIKNLRPLNGMLHDRDGPRNVNSSIDQGNTTGLFDGEVVVFHSPPVANFFPTTRRPGIDIRIPLPPPAAAPPLSFAADFPEIRLSIEDSFNDGIAASIQQQEVQNNRPSVNLDQTEQFQSAFRRAEKEAEEASCVGRALIEISKDHAKKLQKSPCDEFVGDELTDADLTLDRDKCHRELKSYECEDFKRPSPCLQDEKYRRIDGSCNNLENPTWGKAMAPFARYYYPRYENCLDTMRGEGRNGANRLPSARTISYNIQKVRENPPLQHITLMVMQFGQFLDHDITFTAETQIKKRKERRSRRDTLARLLSKDQVNADTCPHAEESETVPLECCPNGNPIDDAELVDCRPIDTTDDPLFKEQGRTCMHFVRSLIASKGCTLGPREQLNQITSYIDGSAVYGSTDNIARALRTLEGGHMHSTRDGKFLPRNCCEDRTATCFKAGDSRVNEQPGLASMHTLWLRVHEKLVDDFARENPKWNDEKLYQEARRVLIALLQQVVYREWLPVVVGPRHMDEHELHLADLSRNLFGFEYDPEEDASIRNVIATAAFRFGHTLVSDFLRASGDETVPLVGNFFNSKVLFEEKSRPSVLLEGLASSSSQAPDFNIVLTLTNRLFAPAEAPIGLDLMSLNIQRGRDHGIPPYNTWRTAVGLKKFTAFKELNSALPLEIEEVFKKHYSDVDEIDLFPAALSEYPVDGGLVGPTFAFLLASQFSSLKKGDRFFFQNMKQPEPFNPDQLESISKINFASILCHHSDIQQIQPDVFHSAGYNGNDIQPCSSYPTLDTSLWKEKQMPQPEVMTCEGIGSFNGRIKFNTWCTTTCFHNPEFCPPEFCSCRN